MGGGVKSVYGYCVYARKTVKQKDKKKTKSNSNGGCRIVKEGASGGRKREKGNRIGCEIMSWQGSVQLLGKGIRKVLLIGWWQT